MYIALYVNLQILDADRLYNPISFSVVMLLLAKSPSFLYTKLVTYNLITSSTALDSVTLYG